jgi:hypothetical protein
VDDLVILANLTAIDGPGAVLGAAGPCLIRVSGNLPAVGQMRFDIDDLELLEVSDVLGAVILHEMGHVLGIGTLWSLQDLLADPSLSGGTDPHFTGPLAIRPSTRPVGPGTPGRRYRSKHRGDGVRPTAIGASRLRQRADDGLRRFRDNPLMPSPSGRSRTRATT